MTDQLTPQPAGVPQPQQPPQAPQPQQVPQPGAKPRSIRKLVIGSVLGLFNAAVAVVVGFVVLFVVSESLNPNPAGIAIIALAPMAAIALMAACVVDGVALGIYVFSKRPKTPFKAAAARIGLVACLAVLGAIVFLIYWNIHSIRQFQSGQNASKGTEFQQLKDRAESNGTGFDILLPSHLPKGYAWGYGQVSEDLNDQAIFFDGRYQTTGVGDEFDFDLIEYSKRPTFTPPANCGYYNSPFESLDDPKTYPCTLAGKTSSGGTVYYYAVPGHGPGVLAEDAYYMQTGRDVAIISFVKDPKAPSRDEVLKILGSLGSGSVDDLVKNNTKSGE